MTIKDKAIQEIKDLNDNDVQMLYRIIQSMKQRSEKPKENSGSYQKVREALKGINGSLSEDIVQGRNDRI